MLLSALYGLIGHYGYTIIVFTLIIRILLFPLYANQVKHMARMSEVQPKMQALQKKYANDKETLNMKMMELYKEEKFNPMLGCLPMLIQLPIIAGLFSLLRNPAVYMSDMNMWIAAHEDFFWVPDLSQPDPWVLPILAGVSTFFSFMLSQKTGVGNDMSNPMSNQMAPMMKMMKYFFPISIVWMGRSFPAGLTVYWFVGTAVQIGQTQILNIWKKRLIAKNAPAKSAAGKA
jgi:YidC/Oxa1 family membrane protein insertase